jgi:hypothetical protein
MGGAIYGDMDATLAARAIGLRVLAASVASGISRAEEFPSMPSHQPEVSISDLRGETRFLLLEPMSGTFGSSLEIAVLDLSSNGARIEHSQPVRLGTRGRLVFRRAPDIHVTAHGLAIWSRLSTNKDSRGKLLYQSGIRIDEPPPEFKQAISTLAGSGMLQPDRESLERKRQQLQERSRPPLMKLIRPEQTIPPDHILIVQQARERLKTHPDEALKWYNRARFSLTNDASGAAAAEMIDFREDLLAVWEYLERSIDLLTIVRVLEKKV